MRSFTSRRIRNVALFLLAVGLVALLAMMATTALRSTAWYSGWTLWGLVVFLLLYNVRKKIPFLPLGSSAAWLQLHCYVGLFTAVLFGIHMDWHVPTGVFERALALLYLIVFLSGVVGLFLSRSFARRLTTRGDEVIFERIPSYRKKLDREVEAIVLQSLQETQSTAVSQFYVERLKHFFSGPRHFWQHFFQSDRARHRLEGEIKAYDHYLDESERETMQEIATYVQRKDDLDYQHALQATLKYWLFAHVPLSYALFVFTLLHLVLVMAF